jgi:hypothetical protein
VSARRPPSPYAWITISADGKGLIGFAEGGDAFGGGPGTTDGVGDGCSGLVVGVPDEGRAGRGNRLDGCASLGHL